MLCGVVSCKEGLLRMPVLASPAKSLLSDLSAARAQSDRLFGSIKPEALYDRPIDARHRVLFYIGHLDGFDSIQICREGAGVHSAHTEFDSLFQAGIDPDSGSLPKDTPRDWPSLKQLNEYVRYCREHVDRCIGEAPEETVHMAVEHRQMHLETLAYMFHNFDYSLKLSPDRSVTRRDAGRNVPNSWCEVDAGSAYLGTAKDGSFAWDNEYEAHTMAVPAFRMQRFSVTNGQWLEFMKEGGPMPHFWSRRGDSLVWRGMFEEYPLPLDGPVYVTHQQATQYADWLGKALPSEAQFHRAAYGTPDGRTRSYPWGEEPPSVVHGTFDFREWDPTAVDSHPAGTSAWGISDLVGNGWEWTSTAFGPFPGFAPRPSYPGYSANFFDGEHYVMKGGSPQTAARLLRASFRNWFRKDYPYMYSKFRCVEIA